METFKQIRSWVIEQDAARGDASAVVLVGTAICTAIVREAEEEAQRITRGAPSLSGVELLNRALQNIEDNRESKLMEAEQLVQRQSVSILEECVYRAVERSRLESQRENRPVFFAIWTGVAANFVWLFVSFLIAMAAILILGGPSIEDIFKNSF